VTVSKFSIVIPVTLKQFRFEEVRDWRTTRLSLEAAVLKKTWHEQYFHANLKSVSIYSETQPYPNQICVFAAKIQSLKPLSYSTVMAWHTLYGFTEF